MYIQNLNIVIYHLSLFDYVCGCRAAAVKSGFFAFSHDRKIWERRKAIFWNVNQDCGYALTRTKVEIINCSKNGSFGNAAAALVPRLKRERFYHLGPFYNWHGYCVTCCSAFVVLKVIVLHFSGEIGTSPGSDSDDKCWIGLRPQHWSRRLSGRVRTKKS